MKSSGMARWGIDFVGIDVFGKRFVDGLIETSEQLGQGFASAADQYGQAIVCVGGGSDTTDRVEYADGDFAIAN
jgi:hypothetical protein